jgi:hypothetical protein
MFLFLANLVRQSRTQRQDYMYHSKATITARKSFSAYFTVGTILFFRRSGLRAAEMPLTPHLPARY